MVRLIALTALAATIFVAPASAAPGLDAKVYGTTVEKGVTEFESRYGQLTGGADNGESALVLEVAHGFSDRLYGAILATIDHNAGGDNRLGRIGFEAIYRVGTIPVVDIDFALYGEYEAALRDKPHNLEVKALFEKRVGRFDARLNLIAERQTTGTAPTEFGYAVSADYAVVGDEVRLGFAAFGDLGSTDQFGGRQPHFIGPAAKFEIEHLPIGGELEIGTGYLFAIGAARDAARGQARLSIEWETKF